MVNIDNVYQKVLAIANKEQRGYVTPQEFNLFADQAQMDIFEQYFYDLSQFKRRPGTQQIEADIVNTINDKLSLFSKFETLDSNYLSTSNPIRYRNQPFTLPNDFYRFQDARSNTGYAGVAIEKLTKPEFFAAMTSPLTRGTNQRPIMYLEEEDRQIWVMSNNSYWDGPPENSGTPITRITLQYFKKPSLINWGYNVIGENALYDPNKSINFELHSSEENNLVMKILSLAGISMKDAVLYQAAEQQDNKNIQQEKS
jgi:hypothetical protein